jgi:4-amino-4-deoxy-L-arabinose transferase-like glycosyltransferase
MRQHTRWQRWTLLAITMAIALIAVLPAALHVRVAEYDEAIFLDVANNIKQSGLPFRSLGAEGQVFLDHPPLYVYFLSLFANLSESEATAARWVNVLIGLGAVALTFFIGMRLSNTTGGFVAALLLALSPFFLTYLFFVRMEIPMIFAMLLALALLIQSDGARRAGRVGVAGIALGIAVLLKENALVFALCCLAYVLWCRRHDGRAMWKPGALIAAPVAIALGGWMLWAWHLSPIGFADAMRRWISSAAPGALLDPRTTIPASRWAEQVTFDLLGLAWVAALAASFAISISGRGRRIDREGALLWGYLLLSVTLSFGITLKEPRHLIGILPIAALIIGISIDWKRDLVARSTARPWRMAVVALIAGGYLVWASPIQVQAVGPKGATVTLRPPYRWRVQENDHFYNVLRLAGNYLREQTPPTEPITVAHQATVTGYYANRHYSMLYTLSLDPILQVLAHTRYLVWDDPIFLAVSDEQLAIVQDYIAGHFAIDQVIRDDYRQVTVYRRNTN